MAAAAIGIAGVMTVGCGKKSREDGGPTETIAGIDEALTFEMEPAQSGGPVTDFEGGM